MSIEDFHNTCKDNKLYQKLNREEREFLFKLGKRKQFRRGDVIFYSSESDKKEFFIVEKGDLELNLNSGKEKIYKKNDLFGEISVLNSSPRMGTMTALTDGSLIEFDGGLLFSDKIIPTEVSISIYKGLVDYVISYLDEEYKYATESILNKGEGGTIEFKESLSRTLKAKVIETICAFLNTRGGTILIGVRDDSKVIGLRIKSEKEIDSYKQSVILIIKDKVGSSFTSCIQFNTEKIMGHILLRINCAPSRIPAILEERGEQIFFMRSGPTNIKAPNIKELLSYYRERFAGRD